MLFSNPQTTETSVLHNSRCAGLLDKFATALTKASNKMSIAERYGILDVIRRRDTNLHIMQAVR